MSSVLTLHVKNRILPRVFVQRMRRHFIFFLNSSPSPEFQNYFLLVVFTFHFRLIESFPPISNSWLLRGRYLYYSRLQGRTANIHELEIFRAIFTEITNSRLGNTSEIFPVLYKKIDWTLARYLVSVIQLDLSFDSKPFFKVLMDRSNNHASTLMSYCPLPL